MVQKSMTTIRKSPNKIKFNNILLMLVPLNERDNCAEIKSC